MAQSPPTQAELERCVHSMLDHRAATEYLRRARPCVYLVPTRVQDESQLRMGQTRIGGRPDMPRDLQWPQFNGVPLEFVAQVALPEVAGVDPDMPRTGWLWFFYSMTYFPGGFKSDDADGWRVLHWQGEASALRRCDPPAFDRPKQSVWQRVLHGRIGDRIRTFNACSVELVRTLSLSHNAPDGVDEELVMEEIVAKCGDGALYSGSWIFGLESPVQGLQGEMAEECEQIRAGRHTGRSGSSADSDWILLLQLDSEDKASMMWGDAGMLYYWIRRSDLKARRFDQAWLFMQCC